MSNNKFKVLIIEDEANICSFIQTLLETNGYQALVAQTCVMGMTMFISYNPDLVILDLGLPDRDAIRSIRQKYLTPIIVLSARTTEQDKIEALDLGANDYITKPFGTGELLARVRAALRVNRYGGGSLPGGVFSAQGLTINYERRKVFVDGQEVRLTQTEYNIVAFRARRARADLCGDRPGHLGRHGRQQHQEAAGEYGQYPQKAGQPPGQQYLYPQRAWRRLSDDRRRRKASGTCGGDEMTLALSLFVLFYILMLAVQQYRPWVALGGAGVFLLLGKLGVYDFTLADAARAVDFNVLLMMAGMMGTVFLFIQSKMPARLAEELIAHVPDVRWAVSVLALLAGFISAFVDNVATVLMVAPVGLAIARRLKLSPVPVLIAIAVSSNLQGAATLVGDTTSILLGGFAGMNFFDFFWMEGRPGIFWSVELGALASLGVLFWLFRDQRQPVHVTVETEVEDDVPTALLLLTVGLLIAASFLPEPSGSVLHLLYTLRSGLVCMGLCLFGAARACWRSRSLKPLAETFRALDYDTLLLLFSLFILLEGVSRAGVIDAAAQLFHSAAGDEPLHLYLLLVAASVGLSAFIDNIPYVAAMLPVVQGVAALMNGGAGIEPELFYFGLLTGATLGGNLTPIGASANIAAIGILRKNGETVRTRDFLRIGVPFTLAAVLVGAGSLWLFWGI